MCSCRCWQSRSVETDRRRDAVRRQLAPSIGDSNDAEAYRRDRRKDRLLQENGYFVLRFLAEDIGKHVDEVLDAIMRTLSRRRRERLG